LYKELEITESAYNALLKRIKPLVIFQYLTEYGIGRLSLYYYVDRIGGSFIKPKYKTDLIANAIFDGLNTKDKMSIFEYIEWVTKHPEKEV
jgi:hypothetical protein